MEIYKCSICGNIVEKHVDKKGILSCCNKEMILLKEFSENEGNEKHKPVIEKTKNGIRVKVGSILHPMTKEHSIKFIQILKDNKTYTKYLEATKKPEAEFDIEYSKDLKAREFCNLHGLWTNE